MLYRVVLILVSLLGLCLASLPCGKPAPKTRIVGGSNTKTHKVPWEVDLTEPRMSIPFCAGVLVHPQFVLTAASCTKKKATFDLLINEHNWEFINRVIRRKPAETIVHPNYSGGDDYNVALIKLSDGPVMSVPTVCLDDKKLYITKRTKFFTAGWGATEKGGMVSPGLKQMNVKLMKECVDETVNKNVTLCSMSFVSGGKGLCTVDEGDPLTQFKNRKHTLVGIGSSGGCGEQGAMDYFTNVKAPEIKEWMDTIITSA